MSDWKEMVNQPVQELALRIQKFEAVIKGLNRERWIYLGVGALFGFVIGLLVIGG